MDKKQKTKVRLVQAAADIFSEKGFREATVAEICEQAEANIAAVNYHFGDKSSLYKAVWDYLHQATLEQFPVPETHTEIGAERWLRQFLRSRLMRIMAEGPSGLYPKLIHREMTEITAEHEYLFVTYLRPNRLRVRSAIADFIEQSISEEQLSVATLNFMGVHISMNVGYQKHIKNPALQKKFPANLNSEILLQQAESFAIGGLKEVKKGLNS
ncbi:TetR/AcrR family transcriptional regulator [Pontiellaceae bacterium B12227]|nr:TetR/AcrR family transcriptional regulator [Pontiellaceae bacterium B12227]